MDPVALLGFAAAAMTTAAFFPQAIQIYRDSRDPAKAAHATDGINLPTYAVFATGVALWLAYGLARADWPVVAANAITLLPALGIVVLTIRQRRAKARS